MQGCDLLLNWRPHAKIQLIWEKKTDQNSTEHGYAPTSSFVKITADSVAGIQWNITTSVVHLCFFGMIDRFKV